MPLVILDTSSLLITYEGIDIFSSIEELLNSKCYFLVPHTVIEELLRLSLKGGRKSRAANLTLKLLRGKVFVYGLGRFRLADEEVKELSKLFKNDLYVVTLDDELKKVLKGLGIKVITWWFSKYKFVEV